MKHQERTSEEAYRWDSSRTKRNATKVHFKPCATHQLDVQQLILKPRTQHESKNVQAIEIPSNGPITVVKILHRLAFTALLDVSCVPFSLRWFQWHGELLIQSQLIKGEISSSLAYLAAGRHSDLDIWARWQLRVAAFVLSPWLLDMDLSLVGDMCVFFRMDIEQSNSHRCWSWRTNCSSSRFQDAREIHRVCFYCTSFYCLLPIMLSRFVTSTSCRLFVNAHTFTEECHSLTWSFLLASPSI